MSVLVTGVAGFIGFSIAKALLEEGKTVVGLDSLNTYYDVALKQARLQQLLSYDTFSFHQLDLADRHKMASFFQEKTSIDLIIHLAAQAGVRYSLENPFAYADSNLLGHLAILEGARQLPHLKQLIYASSSSVYGGNDKLPFSVEDPVNKPLSLYAASKRSCEMMSYSYAHLYQIPMTGLRFFTVYGPWGRPDMSAFIFAKAILAGEELPVFNQGRMRRNFTYIDDVVQGIKGVMKTDFDKSQSSTPFRLYNIGNDRSEGLLRFIEVLESHLGCPAKLKLLPMQPGDVKETVADISQSTQDFGFKPQTNIEEGLKHFCDWYQNHYHQKQTEPHSRERSVVL